MRTVITILAAAALVLSAPVSASAQTQSRADRIAERVRDNADRHLEYVLERNINRAMDKAIDRAFKTASRESRRDSRKDAWTCPACGQKGNTGAYCPTCGHCHAAAAAPQVSAKAPVKDSRTVTPPLPEGAKVADTLPEQWKGLNIVNGELRID